LFSILIVDSIFTFKHIHRQFRLHWLQVQL